MPILKFATIEKYVELLTNNQWLLDKADAEKIKKEQALVKLRGEVQELIERDKSDIGMLKLDESEQKKLTLLQERIYTLENALLSQKSSQTTKEQEQSSSSSDTKLEITEKTGLTPEEAFLLLENIGLLKADLIPGFKPECAKRIRSLLYKDFQAICDSAEGYEKLKDDLNSGDSISQDVGNLGGEKIKQIVIAIRFMGMNLNYILLEILTTAFENNPDEMLAYLKAADYSTVEAFERYFSFPLPDMESLSENEKKFWHRVNVNFGREGCYLFSDANRFSKSPEFQEIVTKYLQFDEWRQEHKTELKAELRNILALLKYKNAEKNPELAKLFSFHQIPGPTFNAALEFIKTNGVKKSDDLPDISFKFKVRTKEYTFEKVAPGDPIGFILGKITDCCQNIDGLSAKCVEDGMSKQTAGFYLIKDEKGKIAAQFYAWLAQDDVLVLDSYQSLGKDGPLFVEAAKKFYQELQKLDNPLSLVVGTGGGTPEINVQELKAPAPLERIFQYGDSEMVYRIDENIKLVIESNQNLTPTTEEDRIKYWFKGDYNPRFNFELFFEEVGLGGAENSSILCNKNIGDAGATAIAEALKTNTTLTSLNLFSNVIRAEGATAIAEALKINTTLTSLNLGNNKIGDAGAKAIAEALKTNTTLTSLNLGDNKIGAEGATAIAEALTTNTTLTSLDLGDNRIEVEGAKAIAEALKTNTTLTSLNLFSNVIRAEGATAIAEALKINTTLTSLNLSSSGIRAERATAIAEALKINTTLTSLDLSFNGTRAEEATAIAEALKINTTLTSLNLGNNKIGDAGAKAIAEALTKNTTLTSLNLVSNDIEAEGATAIAEALKTNTTLTSLNLFSNVIRAEGATAIAEALKTNTTLTSLNLVDSKIGNEGAKAIAEALKTNTTLTSLTIGYIRSNYDRNGNEGATAIAEALKTNTTLTSLDLGYNEIGDAGATAIAEALKTNTTLTSLHLGHNEIGDEGATAIAEALKTNTTLTSLTIGGYGEIKSEGIKLIFEALTTNTTLTSLNLGEEEIGEEELEIIAEALKTNTTLTNLKLNLEDEKLKIINKLLERNRALAVQSKSPGSAVSPNTEPNQLQEPDKSNEIG